MMAESQDIKIYTERLKKQYGELLAYRQGILRQTEIEEARLADLRAKEKEIIDKIGGALQSETADLLKLKDQNAAFLASLEADKQIIIAEHKRLADFAEDLNRQNALCEAIKEGQLKELNALEYKRKELEKRNALTETKEIEIIAKMAELEEKVNLNADDKNNLEQEIERNNNTRRALANREKKILLQEDYIKQSAMALQLKEDNLNKERAHLESQQQTLKLSFEEARKKNLL